jgi:hypothetical protein
MAVTTFTRLNHPDLPATAEAVVASLNPTEAKIKAVIYADLATAAGRRADFDRAADHASRALDVNLSQEASLGAERLRQLRDVIAPHVGVPVLAELHERLASL